MCEREMHDGVSAVGWAGGAGGREEGEVGEQRWLVAVGDRPQDLRAVGERRARGQRERVVGVTSCGGGEQATVPCPCMHRADRVQLAAGWAA
ncbi:hypothetical protein [Pseudofrankia sp. BMG5.37]|uniref:hypothetical protein n=1 Tax=Pseudofrankia sp. BMG5.37 TaxID=3050035 RepID=UPI002894F4B6|nr:hypothetical protein [Pseudofrankia sp. BMG5.37]MDT3443152.1 hypothetical protein [Pseudofrankia sp. BMG5.37]